MAIPYHGVSGKLTAQPGKGQELLQILLDAAQGMEAVDGCLCYIVGTSDQEPDVIHIYEVWVDEAAHQASLGMPVFQSLIARAKPIIAGMDNDPNLKIHGGKTRPIS